MTRSAPPVSIVMPVRNGLPFVEEALASIEAQTYGDFEIVVQDDGSTDATPDVLEAWTKRDARLRFAAGPGRGVAHAANEAMRRARGALLVRMDADDVCRPERVEQLVAFAAAHPDVGYFGSRTRYMPRATLGPGMRRYEGWLDGLLTHEDIHASRFVEYPIPHPSTAVRREVVDAIGGYRQGPFPEDYDWFLRAAAAGVRFGKHPDVLLDWREGDHRSTKRDPRYGLDRFRALKLEHLVPLLTARGRPVALVGAGRDGKAWAHGLQAAGCEVACFVDRRPGRRDQRIAGVPVKGDEVLDERSDLFLLVAIGRDAIRAELRTALTAGGRSEGRDFLCVQ